MLTVPDSVFSNRNAILLFLNFWNLRYARGRTPVVPSRTVVLLYRPFSKVTERVSSFLEVCFYLYPKPKHIHGLGSFSCIISISCIVLLPGAAHMSRTKINTKFELISLITSKLTNLRTRVVAGRIEKKGRDHTDSLLTTDISQFGLSYLKLWRVE